MPRPHLFAAALLTIAHLRGQPTAVSGPIEGFTFDAPTASIRAVVGLLGSSTLGPAIVPSLSFASVAPGQNYGIAVRGLRTFLVSGLGSTQVSAVAVSGLSSLPEGVAWSGDGSVAVVYSKTGGWIQSLTGLPAAINVSAPVSITTLGGTLSTVAADSDGQTIVIGVTGEYAGVYKLTEPDTSFSPMLQMSQPIALAFSEDGSTVYALDASTNAVSEIDLASSASQTWPALAKDAVAIQPGIDATNQKVLYVASGSGQLLQVYSRVTRQVVASVPLTFSPTVIDPLGTSSFVLNSRVASGDLLWSFTNRGQPSVSFIPAMPNESEYQQEVLRK